MRQASTTPILEAHQPEEASGAPRGVVRGSPQAVLVQRTAALAVFVLPSVGVVIAAAQVIQRGFRASELALLGVSYLVTCLGITAGFHRHFAHRAFETSPALEFVLAAFGSMAAQGPLAFWVATHRRHHAYSDRPGDPHSPHLAGGRFAILRGFVHSHMGWMLSEEMTSWPVFARDILRSPYAFWLHRQYWTFLALGLLLPAGIGWLAWGGGSGLVSGLVWGGLGRIWLFNQASWCVGSVSHLWGARPFVTRDQSANNWAVALLTAGEGLQNNHHAFPSSAVHALEWWEPDLAGTVIRGLQRLGLVWDVHVPSAEAIARVRHGSTVAQQRTTAGISPEDAACGGLCALGFDSPAHGLSKRRYADLMDCSDAIDAAIRQHGPFCAAVGHSFGAAALVLHAFRFGTAPERLALIGAPSSIVWLTDDFARRWQLSPRIARRMRGLMQRRSGLPWQHAHLPGMLARYPGRALVVHDRDDAVVPYRHAQRLAAEARNVQLYTTRGRGHSGTLTDASVVERVVAFISSPTSNRTDQPCSFMSDT